MYEMMQFRMLYFIFTEKITAMKYIFALLFLAVAHLGSAQRISKITISGTGNTEMISIQTDDAVINLTPDGTMINYGVEYESERVTGYTRIEPYMGRVDMFSTYDDKAFQGKVKYLGKTAITYYASYEDAVLQGKIKSIGSLMIDYYMPYEDEAFRGKIKDIGSSALTYFSNFDNKLLKGKLKSLGFTSLNYYSSYDDKAFSGKIKSIGQVSFTYYPSYDNRYAGSIKTGSQLQNVNGVNYYIKF